VIGSPVPDEGGAATLERWARAHDGFVKMLKEEKASPEYVRRVALARLLCEYWQQGSLRSGRGLGPEVFNSASLKEWMPRASDEMTWMPFLGRFWHMNYARLRNGAPWKSGDLADMSNLSTAAGYATVVAGERRTIGDLRTMKQISPGAQLATSLHETVVCVLRVIMEQALKVTAA
jgi:hypothetical protein